MSDAQDEDNPPLPVEINDSSVVPNTNFEGVNGTEASQVSSGIHRDRPKLSGDSLSDGLVQLLELFGGEFRELNTERQPLIPLSSSARALRSFTRELVGETRRYPRSSSRSGDLPGRAQSHTGRIRTSRGSPVPGMRPKAASLALS